MTSALTATARASSSDASLDFIQKNAHKVSTSNASPTKTTRQTPKASRIGRSTARGGRCITSSSCGSNEMTRPSATDVTILTQRICGAVIGAVKPTKIATIMTNACATLVGSMNNIAFSMLL